MSLEILHKESVIPSFLGSETEVLLPSAKLAHVGIGLADKISSSEERIQDLTAVKKAEEEAPVLEIPHEKSYIFDPDEDYSVTSEVSRMATALCLANQYSYQVQFKQAIETSSYSAMLAPIVRDLVLGNWDNQAAATECDADKSFYAGIGILVTGVGGLAIGAWTYFSEAKSATDVVVDNAAKQGAGAAAAGAEGAAGRAVAGAERAAVQEAEVAGGAGARAAERGSGLGLGSDAASDSSRATPARVAAGSTRPPAAPTADPATPAAPQSATRKNLEKGASAGSKALKMGQVVTKMLMTMHALLALGEGGIKLGVDQKYDYKKAGKQKLIGQYDAHEKEASAYQGGANSSSQRMSEASSQSQKTHGDALEILKRVAETISNAVSAVHRV